MTIETHQNDAERRFFVTPQRFKDILPGNLCKVYIVSLTQKPVNLAKLIFGASLPNALSHLRHAVNGERYMMNSRVHTSTHGNSTNLVHAGHYKPQESQDEQVDRRDAVKELDGNANFNWPDVLCMSNKYVAYRDKIVERLAQFVRKLDGLLKAVKALQHRVALAKLKVCPIDSAPYQALPWSREFGKRAKERMLVINDIETAESDCAPPLVFVSRMDGLFLFCNSYQELNAVKMGTRT